MPGIGRVAVGSLLMRLNQARIATASIAALIGTTMSLWILTTSLAETLDLSISTNGGATITANDFLDQQYRELLRADIVRLIADSPGVEAVFEHYISQTIYRGETIRINASTSRVWAERRGFDLLQRAGPDPEIVRGLQAGGVIVYDSFQRHFGVNLGDLIELDTPQGKRSFPVVGVRPAYQTGSAGGVQMDLAIFDQYWPRRGVSNLVVWTKGTEQRVLDELQLRAGTIQPVFSVAAQSDLLGMHSAATPG